MRIYVASSWRNSYQPDVVFGLRELGHEVYDFRNLRDGDNGFLWAKFETNWQSWTVEEYVKALENPIAENRFQSNFEAMKWANACVLVMPCGRSAHLEAGWFVGAKKPLLILDDKSEPELMYKMANGVFGGLGPLMLQLQEIEDGSVT